jgi:hypothetical protein
VTLKSESVQVRVFLSPERQSALEKLHLLRGNRQIRGDRTRPGPPLFETGRRDRGDGPAAEGRAVMSGTDDGKNVVIVQVRISPRQAERLEKCYRILGINKSKITEIALDEFFSAGQEEVMRKVRTKRP